MGITTAPIAIEGSKTMFGRSRDLFVGLLLVFALGACGGGSSQDDAQSAASPTVAAAATSVPATATESAPPATPVPSPTVSSAVVTATAGTSESIPATPTVAPSAPELSATSVTATTSSAVTTTNDVTTTTAVTTAVTAGDATSGASNPAEAADPAVLAAGLAAYHANYCGVCHTLDKAETRGTFGPTHNGLAAQVDQILAQGIYHGAAKTPAEYVRESIVAPQLFIVPGYATTSHRMPSYAHLDDATINALVVFLLAP